MKNELRKRAELQRELIKFLMASGVYQQYLAAIRQSWRYNGLSKRETIKISLSLAGRYTDSPGIAVEMICGRLGLPLGNTRWGELSRQWERRYSCT